MFWKYVRIMEFYHEAKDKRQMGAAKKEFQEILKITNEIMEIENVEIGMGNC
jgi:hypothetical protein